MDKPVILRYSDDEDRSMVAFLVEYIKNSKNDTPPVMAQVWRDFKAKTNTVRTTDSLATHFKKVLSKHLGERAVRDQKSCEDVIFLMRKLRKETSEEDRTVLNKYFDIVYEGDRILQYVEKIGDRESFASEYPIDTSMISSGGEQTYDSRHEEGQEEEHPDEERPEVRETSDEQRPPERTEVPDVARLPEREIQAEKRSEGSHDEESQDEEEREGIENLDGERAEMREIPVQGEHQARLTQDLAGLRVSLEYAKEAIEEDPEGGTEEHKEKKPGFFSTVFRRMIDRRGAHRQGEQGTAQDAQAEERHN